MTKYREILRLKSLGYSERNIALCCSVSRNTVAKVCARAKELGITWPLAPDQTDKVLSKMLFPKEKTTAKRRMPDYEWVRKELLNGLSKKGKNWSYNNIVSLFSSFWQSVLFLYIFPITLFP